MNNGNNVYQSLSSSKSSERLGSSEEQNSEMSFNLNNRSSTASTSSHTSSSGFESMKSDCSQNTVGKKSDYRNSTFQTPCSLPFHSCNVQSTSIRDDSPQSRCSLHSTYSGGGLSIPSNSSDDVRHINLNICSDANSVDICDLVHKGHPEAEILALWLDKLGISEYLRFFLMQGYDLSTIARITPEDLSALGVTQPNHRKILMCEIHKWRVSDPWPVSLPSDSLREWLSLISLAEYVDLFESQGYYRLSEVLNLTWEDFEDIGVKKLGHLKRLGLAIRKLKTRKPSVNDQFACKVPPPPAPKSSCPPSKQLYSAWNRCNDPLSIDSNVGMQLQSQKPTVQVQPHHRSPCSENEIEDLKNFKNDAECLAKPVSSIGRLNLFSSSQILSLQPYNTTSYGSDKEASKSVISSYPNNDSSFSSDCEEYPPPPAPLACEGSIRLLRSAFHQKSNFDRNDIHLSNYHDSSTSSSFEQIPFANDNCGTIKSRDATFFMGPASTNSAASMPNTPRRDTHLFYRDDNRSTNIINCVEEMRQKATREDLTSAGSMLKNLTEELDALLVGKGSS